MLLYSQSNPDAQYGFDGFPSRFIGQSKGIDRRRYDFGSKSIAIKHLQKRKDTINRKNESTTLGGKQCELSGDKHTTHINISHYFVITYKTTESPLFYSRESQSPPETEYQNRSRSAARRATANAQAESEIEPSKISATFVTAA